MGINRYIHANQSTDPRHEKACFFFFCIYGNKDAAQLCSNRAADGHLSFRCIHLDSTTLYFVNPKVQASKLSMWLYSPICVRPGQNP